MMEKKYRFLWLFQGLINIILIGVLVMVLISPPTIKQTSSQPSQTQTNSTNININGEDVTENISKAMTSVVSVITYVNGERYSSGSGVVYKNKDGKSLIVTNDHVVNKGNSYDVTLSDGQRYEAKLIGSDRVTDLAILEVDVELKPIAIGSSSSLSLAEPVYALGSPLGLEGSVTQGIVSTILRTIETDLDGDGTNDYQINVIQTDAAINPGNSGGALVNIKGELVGINSQKIADASVDNIGFAIPFDEAIVVLEQLEANGKIVRPTIGIQIADLSQLNRLYYQEIKKPKSMDELYGVYVYDVTADNGLKKGDVITAINGEKIDSSAKLRAQLYRYQIGDTIKVDVLRDGEVKTIEVKLIGG